jgi:cytochrome P450
MVADPTSATFASPRARVRKAAAPSRLPPSPGFGPVAMVRAYRRDPIGVLAETARRCGDISTFRVGPYRVYLVNHPDLIGDVLVTNARRFHKGRFLRAAKALLGEGLLTSEDPLHLRQRRLAQPAFQRRRIEAYAAVHAGIAQRCGDRWRDRETVDMAQEMQRLTLDGVTLTLFGSDLSDAEASTVASSLGDALAIFDLLTIPFGDRLLGSPLPAARRFRQARSQLDAVVYRLIERRRDRASEGVDLLSILLAATDGSAAAPTMDARQLRDEAVSMVIAGHETTAHALAWAWYLLAEHPDAEAELHAELDRVLGGRPPSLTDLADLDTCGRVVLETLRLYPPAWTLPRLTVEDHVLAGYPVRAGSGVVISLPLVHRDPRWWKAPEKFDLGRWAPALRAKRPRYAYVPFGAGPRMCIGHDFAMTESVVMLATLAQRWRARLLPGHPVTVQPRFTLRPKGGLPMTLERRGG